MIINLYKVSINDKTVYFARQSEAQRLAQILSATMKKVPCHYANGILKELTVAVSGSRHSGVNGKQINEFGSGGEPTDVSWFPNLTSVPNGIYEAYYCWETTGDTEMYAGTTTHEISFKPPHHGSYMTILLQMTPDAFYAYERIRIEVMPPVGVIEAAIKESEKENAIAFKQAEARDRLFSLQSNIDYQRRHLGKLTLEEEYQVQHAQSDALAQINDARKRR